MKKFTEPAFFAILGVAFFWLGVDIASTIKEIPHEVQPVAWLASVTTCTLGAVCVLACVAGVANRLIK